MKVMLDVQFTKELENNDVLVYSQGVWTNISSKQYFKSCHQKIDEVKEDLEKNGKSLNLAHSLIESLQIRNQNRLPVWAKSIYDNFVDRGLIENDDEFQQMWFDFYFNNKELDLENAPEEYKQILNKVGRL